MSGGSIAQGFVETFFLEMCQILILFFIGSFYFEPQKLHFDF